MTAPLGTTVMDATSRSSSVVRLTGLWFIIGALLQAALAVSSALYGPNALIGGYPYALHSLDSTIWNILAAVARALMLVGAISLAYSGAASERRLAKIGLAFAFAGGAANVLVTASVIIWLNVISASELPSAMNTFNGLDGVTTTVFALGLTLAGIVVLLARRWQGWHRFMPLLSGLYFLVVPAIAFPVSPVAGDASLVLWSIPAVLFGMALRSEAGGITTA
jgi:hypothetical protein